MADKDPASSLSFTFPGVKLMEVCEKDALKTQQYFNDIRTEGTELLMSLTVLWYLQKLIKEASLSSHACRYTGFNFYS